MKRCLIFIILFTISVIYSYGQRTDKPSKKPGIETNQAKARPPFIDNDKDGIEDNIEHALLQKFSPFFLFSDDGGDEDYRPTRVYDYVRQSRLLNSDEENDPNAVVINNNELFYHPENLVFEIPTSKHPTPSSIIRQKAVTSYHIDPTDIAAKGKTWQECYNELNVGLYGHVVQYNQAPPQTDFVNFNYPIDKVYYKIEYWQFFGYNSSGQKKMADHEGDWTTVQLIYSPNEDSIISVFMYSHGSEFRYDMASTIDKPLIEGNTMREFRGPQFKYNPDIKIVDFNITSPHYTQSSDFWKTQNNVVRFYMDPHTGLYLHPVVYIEHGTHEFYPTPWWDYPMAPNHNGKSKAYLTANIPNLGEVENPLNECADAILILQFNGYWGGYSSEYNEPGPGPQLHKQWLWPPSSSIRWLLKDLPF